ncbi:MAG: polysaccharide biosynthesis tyrosine autokinase [Thermoanaerobaculia bacterium]
MSKQPEFFDDEILADEPSHGEVHLSEYWNVIVKRRRLITLAVLVAVVVAAVVSLMTTPLYKANATLSVSPESATPFDIAMTQPVFERYNPEFLATQTRLIRSRQIAERVVDRLKLTENPEFFEKKSGAFQSAGESDPDSATSDRIVAAIRVQNGIETTPVRGTDLVELSFTSTSPKLAAEVANAVAESYIEWSLETKYGALGQASRFLSGQIEQLKAELDDKEKKLQAYSQRTDIVSVDPTTNITLQKLESLNKDYAAAVADRVDKEAHFYQLQNAKPESIADSLSSGLVAQLRNDQAKLERDYAEKLNLFKPEWPAMQQLKAQIDKGRQNLEEVMQETIAKARDVARNDYLTARRREENLKAVLQGQKTEAMALNSNAVEYNNLKTEVETKRALLDLLLKRQAETEINSRLRGERVSNIRVVDRALPPTVRFRPSYRRNGMLALFLGALAGLGLAFLLEYLDRSIRTPEQIESILRLPPLGIIPAVGESNGKGYGYGYGKYFGKRKTKQGPKAAGEDACVVELLPHTHPRAVVAEAYRAFRASLLLSRAGGLKSMVISSTLPGEGKSATAVNLAAVLGQLGKKVLLIDADLHKPRLHEILKMSNRQGLTSILAMNAKPAEIIQQTQVPAVWVVPAGPNSPNPSGLLASDAMKRFLEFAFENFDYVLLDTPPLSLVADAMVLGAATDGLVLTIHGGKTPREQILRVRDMLQRGNVRILGVLLNNLREDAGGYGQYYYYGYSYGYDRKASGI